jgi:hypothetical protein
MPGKRYAIWAALMSVMALAGCCSWCERHCPNCHPPVQACAPCCPQPACCPTGTAYPPPVTAAAPPPQGWQRPGYPQQMNCTCTPVAQ